MRDDTNDQNIPPADKAPLGDNTNSSTVNGSTYIDGSVDGNVLVPNGTFLLDAEYSRVGNDLVLETPDGQNVIVGDYFSQSDAATLINEAGAQVRGTVATKLAGPLAPGQYAQTGSDALGEPIGEIDKISGEVVITGTDGTSRVVGSGDPVFEGDVIVTGADGALGVIFIDKSTMSLSENGRIVLDELIYDPSDFSGSQLIEVVQGAFVFTSGLVGKLDPDAVYVNTPVATIGIRGTQYGVDVGDRGGETTVVLLKGAIAVTSAGGEVLIDEVGYYTFVAGVGLIPTDPALLPASQLQLLMGRAILFHPEEQELASLDDLADGLDDLATAAGGNPPVLLVNNGFLDILNNGINQSDGGAGPLGNLFGGRGLDANDDDRINESNPGFDIGGTGTGGTPSGGFTGPSTPNTTSDIIANTSGDDNLYGYAGNDAFLGGSGLGIDQYYGGSLDGDSGDNDWVIYPSADSGSPLLIDLNIGQSENPNYDHVGIAVDIDPEANGRWIDLDILYGIENALGGDGDDTISGDFLENSLAGGTGNDTITGMTGADVIVGDRIAEESFLELNHIEPGDYAIPTNFYDGYIYTNAGNDILYGDANPVLDSDEGNYLHEASGQIEKVDGNSSIDDAQNIDLDFALFEDDDIENSTIIPHVSVSGTGNGEHVDFYEFNVDTAGSTGVFDVDHTNPLFDFFNSIITILDDKGNVLATGSNQDTVDAGSNSTLDSYLEYTFKDAGTYYIAIGHTDAKGGQTSIPNGSHYELQVSIENHPISGSGNDDIIIGDHDVLLTTDDYMEGEGGFDDYYDDYYGDGEGYYYADAGQDTIYGDQGNDTIIGDNRLDTVSTDDFGYSDGHAEGSADADDDVIFGGSGHDKIVGDNKITTTATTAAAYMGYYAHAMAASEAEEDYIEGGTGNDTIIGDNDIAVYATAIGAYGSGTKGSDYGTYSSSDYYYYSYTSASAEADYIIADDDVLYGDEGNDTIIGDNNVQASAYASTEVDGGYTYARAEADVDADEDLIYGGTGDDTITGDNAISLAAESHADYYYASGANADLTLHVDASDDRIYGENGEDTIVADNDVTITAKANSEYGSAYANVYAEIEGEDDFIDGGADDDHITGDHKISIVASASAASTAGASVTVDIDSDDDTIDGGAGNDYIIGDSEFSVAAYADGTYYTSANVTLHANAGDDTIYENSGMDTIWGGADDDTIIGDNLYEVSVNANGSGSDSSGSAETDIDMLIGYGDDSIYGGSGNDMIYGDNLENSRQGVLLDVDGFNGFDGNFALAAVTKPNLDPTVEGGDDVIYGGTGDDTVFADGGEDWIVGGEDDGTFAINANSGIVFDGGDDLWGTSGNNFYSGDNHKDVFVFRKGDDVDTINDFEVGIDQLVISGYEEHEISVLADGNDTVILFDDGEGEGNFGTDAIRLVDVNASHFARGQNIEEGEGYSGALSAEDIFDLRDDLFDNDSDPNGPPTSFESSIVLVGTMEKLDDGEPDPNID